MLPKNGRCSGHSPSNPSGIPFRGPHGPSQWLRRSRVRRTTVRRPDGSATRAGAVEQSLRPPGGPEDRPAPTGASAHAPRLVSDPRRGPARATPPTTLALLARTTSPARTSAPVHADPPARRRPGRPPHPRCPRSRRNTARPSSRTPRKPRSRSVCHRVSLRAQVRRGRRRPVPLTLRQVDPLIWQLTLYRDLIDRKTGDLS